MLGIALRRITPRRITLRSIALGCRARSNNDNKKNCDIFPKKYYQKKEAFFILKKDCAGLDTPGKKHLRS
jgi:hypothetical protein